MRAGAPSDGLLPCSSARDRGRSHPRTRARRRSPCWLWARGELGDARRAARSRAPRSGSRSSSAPRASGTRSSRRSPPTRSRRARRRCSRSPRRSSQPIKETLERFEQQAQALEEKRLTAVGSIDEHLRTVAQGQERLRKETGSLVTALRAPHVRGRWGEMQLKRVVELAGMLAHCDFVEQASARDDDGRLAPARPRREAPGRQEPRRRLEGAARGVPRRGRRRGRRTRAARTSRATRGSSAST